LATKDEQCVALKGGCGQVGRTERNSDQLDAVGKAAMLLQPLFRQTNKSSMDPLLLIPTSPGDPNFSSAPQTRRAILVVPPSKHRGLCSEVDHHLDDLSE